ncbi:MAG: AmmeMemoRadiSam system protein B [Actinomycetota bacterium]
MHRSVRPPAVAGAFYPADATDLEAEVRAHLDSAEHVELGFSLRMLVAPHAGYVYSGPVAATGYRLLVGSERWRRVVLVGPSHYVWFPGLALPGAGALGTPLGDVIVDEEGVRAALSLPGVSESPTAHAKEHSLEVQLPFLQIVLPGVPVVPLLCGDVGPADVADVVEGLLDDTTLFVVSSDLSHYFDAETARRLDAETIERIERLEPDGLDRESACGRIGIQSALYLARRRGYAVQTLDVRNSSDTAGPPDRVVGYAAIAFGE